MDNPVLDDIPEDFFSSNAAPAKVPTTADIPNAPDPTPAPQDLPENIPPDFFTRAQEKTEQKPTVTGDTPWSDVLSNMKHVSIPDTVNTAVDVAKGIGNIEKAGVSGPSGWMSDIKDLYNADWKGVGKQFYHDYLTEEGWKQALSTRPVNRLLNVGSAFIAPELGAEAVGAEGLAKAAKFAQPASAAVWAGRKGTLLTDNLLNHIAGHFGTYTGGETLNILRDAGMEGGKASEAALQGMAGTTDATNLVSDLRGAVSNMKEQEKNIPFRIGKSIVNSDTQELSKTPVFNSLKNVEARFNTSIDPNLPNAETVQTQATRDALHDTVIDHFMAGAQNPTFLTPRGFDELKGKIDTIYDNAPDEKSRLAASMVRDAVNNEIKAKNLTYANMMQSYATTNARIKELEQEFSLKANGNPSSALRKVLSALRNNVTGNYARRGQLLKQLTSQPNMEHVLPSLAGQVHSSLYPRTLAGAFMTSLLGEGALYGLLHHFTPLGNFGSAAPIIAAHLGMSSPYLMGRAAHATGTAARALGEIPGKPFIYAGKAAGSPYSNLNQ